MKGGHGRGGGRVIFSFAPFRSRAHLARDITGFLLFHRMLVHSKLRLSFRQHSIRIILLTGGGSAVRVKYLTPSLPPCHFPG